jgi:hypothetical protein
MKSDIDWLDEVLISTREYGMAEHFRSIEGSTTRTSYRSIKGHNMSLKGFLLQ